MLFGMEIVFTVNRRSNHLIPDGKILQGTHFLKQNSVYPNLKSPCCELCIHIILHMYIHACCQEMSFNSLFYWSLILKVVTWILNSLLNTLKYDFSGFRILKKKLDSNKTQVTRLKKKTHFSKNIFRSDWNRPFDRVLTLHKSKFVLRMSKR